MAPLPPDHRKQLEKAIVAARVAAERGARKAIESLAVHLYEPHASMSPDERKLRNRLRAHGRQLGDARSEKGAQEIGRLVREVAYEHWHRMLFARFLAENELLIEPSNQVPLSLGDVEDLARERGVDPWSMAAQYAQRMLPQIFRQDDPVLQVPLPPETRQELVRLVVGLQREVFLGDDALGWTYQFWQSAEKDAVNARVKSGEKITGETLPAVTQLFTEHYMVQFLLHNTLGAWHAGKVLAARPELAQSASSEAELRAALALPGYAFDYLRFVRDAEGQPWRPAAGTFAGWPKAARDLRVLDPCCGSGHFLVASFELLVALRQHEDGLDAASAATAVLRDNLFGLELDARCTQIAVFALAMAAWRRCGSVVELPPLQVACCGLGPSGSKEQWLKLAEQAAAHGGMPVKRGLFSKEESLLSAPIRNALEDLYLLFQKAPELGSLIDPKATAAGLFQAGHRDVLPLLERVLRSESAGEDAQEQAVAAQGMAKAAAILGQEFTLVVTNVPYLGRGSQGDVLKEFVEQHYPDAKADLATVFVQRAFGWLGKSGTMAVVTPQNWLFLTSYRKLREKLLKERTWNVVVRMGEHAFESTAAAGAFAGMVFLSAGAPQIDHVMSGVDVSAPRGQRPIYADEKAALLRGEILAAASDGEPGSVGAGDGEDAAGSEGEADGGANGPADGSVKMVPQAEQLKNPDARIVFSASMKLARVADHAIVGVGFQNGDSQRFVLKQWEMLPRDMCFAQLMQVAPEHCEGYSGHNAYLSVSASQLDSEGQSWHPASINVVEGCRFAVRNIGRLPASLSVASIVDQSATIIVPRRVGDEVALWHWLHSGAVARDVRGIDQKLNVTPATFGKVGYDIAAWAVRAKQLFPFGPPAAQTNEPDQWLFHGHPAGMLAAGRADASPFGIADPTIHAHPSLLCRTLNAADVLQVATARLLGYRWPAELDAGMRLDAVQRAWATRSQDLTQFADADGIVCLSPVRGEASGADRLRELLRSAFGPAWQADTERKLLAAAAGPEAEPEATLEDWLRDAFFVEHCKRFHDRPFVWHVWDGRKDGFHALVSYHKLAGPAGEGRRTLELLAFTYLNDWIERQRADIKADVEGADGRLEAALRLQEELKKILHGEPPYDLFVRWKPLHEQPLGWEPDIHDGVRLNIRPFVLAADVKGKDAGLLRSKVGGEWKKEIKKWKSDRGKEPEQLRPRAQFPWFWSWDPENPQHRTDYLAAKNAAFDGVRWNDLHYSRAVKDAARKQREAGGG